jgi:hypothetical protein
MEQFAQELNGEIRMTDQSLAVVRIVPSGARAISGLIRHSAL